MGVDLRAVSDHEATRLVSKPDRDPQRVTATRLFNLLFMEPGSLVMERKMLLEIKKRAERLAIRREAEMPAR